MCCSVSPGVNVHFSDTILYAAEVVPRGGESVHVLGYQNRVQNHAGARGMLSDRLSSGATGNAMILPFPAAPASMTRENVLDTKDCRDVLRDMASAVAPTRLPSRGALSAGASSAPRVQVFAAAGIYTVVLAQDPRDIPAALEQVPESKRPALNPALFDAYAAWYPGWTVALCCFNNRRARLAHPMLWWYRPMHLDRLFLPALDCHTGDVPDLHASVAVDHVLVVGAQGLKAGPEVRYRDALPEPVAPYITPKVIGQRIARRKMPNGDFVCKLEDVRRGVFRPARCQPAAG